MSPLLRGPPIFVPRFPWPEENLHFSAAQLLRRTRIFLVPARVYKTRRSGSHRTRIRQFLGSDEELEEGAIGRGRCQSAASTSEWGCSFRGRELQGFVLEVEGADEVGEHRGDGGFEGFGERRTVDFGGIGEGGKFEGVCY